MNVRSIYGLAGRLLHRPGKEIRILMYHRVNPDKDLPDMHIPVTPGAFRDQMGWLAQNGWRVISLSEAVRQIKNGKIKIPRQVAITFDDGFRDNYHQAFPVLAHWGFPATIFLIAGRIGKDPDYIDFFQAREMQEHGIEFGSHTVTHPDLTAVPELQAQQEIGWSKALLEESLGTIDMFAYPGGRFNTRHCRIARQAGYKAAVTIAPGGNSRGEDMFMLKRTEIARPDTRYDFKNKLYGGFDWRHRYIQKKQGLYPIPQNRQNQE